MTFHSYEQCLSPLRSWNGYNRDDNDPFSRSRGTSNPNKIIDVEAEEVSSPKLDEKKTKNVYIDTAREDEGNSSDKMSKELVSEAVGLAKSAVKGVWQGLSSLFSRKKKAQALSPEEKLKQEIDSTIDEVFGGRNGGLLSGMTKSLLKTAINSIAKNTISDINNPSFTSSTSRSLQRMRNSNNAEPFDDLFISSFSDLFSTSMMTSTSSQESIHLLQSTVETFIRKESTLSKQFGSNLQSFPPVSQSISSMNINGQSSTRVSVQYRLDGMSSSATILTTALITSSNNPIELQNLIIDFTNGQRRDFSAYQIQATLRSGKDRDEEETNTATTEIVVETTEDNPTNDLLRRRWKQ